MRITPIKLATLAAVALGGALALPTPASAAISCTFSSSVLTVNLTANDFPIIRRSGNDIEIRDNTAGQALVPCTGGTPSVTTTERIEVNQTVAGQAVQIVVDQSGGAFEPGMAGPAEGSGTSEIEFDIDLGDGFDSVQINGRPNPQVDHMRFGELASGNPGVNLNGPEAGQPDGDDVELQEVDFISVFAEFADAPNTLDASGGPEFAGGFPLNMGGVAGGEGPDTLIGGDAGGTYDGGGGDDTQVSTPASLFSETVRGGADSDTLDYSRATSAVTVSLAIATGQDTGGGGFDILDQTDFENLIGGPFGDTLTGTNAANRIIGAAGADSIFALDGPDDIDVAGGGSDTADCGPGTDHARADFQLDDLSNCENVDLVGVPPSPPPPPPPPAGDDDPPETTITDGPKRKTKKKRVTLEFVSDEAGSSFECALDAADFSPCASPLRLTARRKGRHEFRARAIDRAGNIDGSPDGHTWKRKRKRR